MYHPTCDASASFLGGRASLVAVIVLLPFSFHAERHLETATRVEGSQAETVRQELATRFHSPFVDRVVLVAEGFRRLTRPKAGGRLRRSWRSFASSRACPGVVSYLDLHDSIFLGKGGGTFVLVGLESTGGPVESLVPALHVQAQALEDQLRAQYPHVKLQLTGEIPLNFDIRKASADDVRRGESLVIPATLILLLIAFGSLVAAIIPLAVGEIAIAATLAITGLLAERLHLSILVQNLATMLGLGLGIDYALLMVSRFREAMCAGNDGYAASVLAARQAGRTLMISASTVAIGFLALLTVPISEIQSIGLAGILVAGLSVLLTNTLVPAVLGLLGRRLDAGRLPFTPKLDIDRAAKTGNRWRRWGQTIVAHPWLALMLAGTPLLLLAWQAKHLDTSIPQGDWLPKSAESVQALHALEQMDRAGIVYSMRVVIELPNDSISQTDAGWDALNRAVKTIESDSRCDRVISIATIANGNAGEPYGCIARDAANVFE